MKKIKKIVSILFFFGLILTIINIFHYTSLNNQKMNGFQVSDDINQKIESSDFWTENDVPYIHIYNDNWTDGGFPWITGGGTYKNPYVIENVTINGENSPTKCGILIEFSNKPFIIRNCTVYNSGDDTSHAAIKLKYTTNGTVFNNTCSNNNNNGIYLTSSSNNNTITNNIVKNNKGIGIKLWLSKYNNISKNTLLYNDLRGIELYTSSHNNTLKDNIITDNNLGFGIYLHHVQNITLSNNDMTSCGIYVYGDELEETNSHNIDTSNKVNSKSVYYIKNSEYAQLDNTPKPGEVILANTNHSIISDLNASDGCCGINILFSRNNTIFNVTSNFCYVGIYMLYSNENNISNNIVRFNERGFVLLYCDSNNITYNTATNNYIYGMEFLFSNNTLVKGNDFQNSGLECWIESLYCYNNQFIDNTCSTSFIPIQTLPPPKNGDDDDYDYIISGYNIYFLFSMIFIILGIITAIFIKVKISNKIIR